jgi:hypothetical protein
LTTVSVSPAGTVISSVPKEVLLAMVIVGPLAAALALAEVCDALALAEVDPLPAPEHAARISRLPRLAPNAERRRIGRESDMRSPRPVIEWKWAPPAAPSRLADERPMTDTSGVSSRIRFGCRADRII